MCAVFSRIRCVQYGAGCSALASGMQTPTMERCSAPVHDWPERRFPAGRKSLLPSTSGQARCWHANADVASNGNTHAAMPATCSRLVFCRDFCRGGGDQIDNLSVAWLRLTPNDLCPARSAAGKSEHGVRSAFQARRDAAGKTTSFEISPNQIWGMYLLLVKLC